jgi:solute carrier family 13 (sodium-dependent dicarboxylate transporter), member 2/3/5
MGWDVTKVASSLTEAEEKFEHQRRMFGLVVGPLALLICSLIPPLPDTTAVGMKTLGIFLWTVIWWVCEVIPIPVTSFLAMALLVFFGSLSVAEGFARWADPINIFLLGAMIIAHATSLHGLTTRIAYTMVASPLVGGKPWRVLLLIGMGAALMSSVMSHVATTMIFLSIATGLAETFKFQKDSRYAQALFLSIAWGSNLGIATPVGTPPNLIARNFVDQLGYRIGFLEWIYVVFPVWSLSMVAMFLVLKFVIRPEMPNWEGSTEFLQRQRDALGPMKRGEKIAGAVFLTAMLLWMLPDLVPLSIDLIQGAGAGAKNPITIWLRSRLDWSVSAIVMATALFLIPLDREKGTYAMSWAEAIKGIEWGTLALIAGALGVGTAIASPKVGLGAFMQTAIKSLSGEGQSNFLFVVMVVAFTIIVGSFISNIAIMGMVGALVLGAAPTATFNPIALMIAVGMAASFDFALPVGTPPSAMVFASGYVKIGTMFKGGAVMSLIGIVLVSTLGYYTANYFIPWPLVQQ